MPNKTGTNKFFNTQRSKRIAQYCAIVIGFAAISGGSIVAASCACIIESDTPAGGSGALGGVTSANIWLAKPGDPTGNCTTVVAPITYIAAKTANRTCALSVGGGQYLDNIVGQLAAQVGTVTTPTLGIPTGKYTASKQIIAYRSSLNNIGCDPLGTWGAASTANCIRIAPESGGQVLFNSGFENHGSDLWIDGSSTGIVTDRTARTYSFKFSNGPAIENDDSPFGTPVDHNTFTGVWGTFAHISGCNHCRYSQMQIGPRIHVERNPPCTGQAGSDNFDAVDGTDGTSWPVNPSDATHLPNVGVPTGYHEDGSESGFQARNGANLQNAVADHIYWYYVTNAGDNFCAPHDGGLFLRGGISNIILADSIWSQDMIYDIQVQNVNGLGTNNNVTLENDWFGAPVNQNKSALAGSAGCPAAGCVGPNGDVQSFAPAVQVDDPSSSWIVRYNSFDQNELSMNYNNNVGCGSGTFPSWQVYGNTGVVPRCNGGTASCTVATGVTFAKNVWDGGTCGGTDTTQTIANIYTNTAIGPSMNLFLKGAAGSTTADNFVSGTGTTAPSNSIDNTAVGSSPWDAGSQQR